MLKKRGYWTGDEMQAVAQDDDVLPTVTATDFHGTKNNGSGNPTRGSKILCKAGKQCDTNNSLDSLSAHSWHGHDIRGSGKLVPIAAQSGREAVALADDDVMPSAFANQSHGLTEGMKLRLGLQW